MFVQPRLEGACRFPRRVLASYVQTAVTVWTRREEVRDGTGAEGELRIGDK